MKDDVVIVPVSDNDRELLRGPSLANQLPVRFGNGFGIDELIGNCAKCCKQITGENMRGRVVTAFKGVAVIDAIGVCRECNLITRFGWRIREDKSFEMRNKDGGWDRGVITLKKWDHVKDTVLDAVDKVRKYFTVGGEQ